MKSVNQYVIYGTVVSINTQEKWDLGGNEDLSILFNTRDGECVIIGRILQQSSFNTPMGLNEPLSMDELKLSDADELIIQNSVGRKFGVAGTYHYYLVSQIRR